MGKILPVRQNSTGFTGWGKVVRERPFNLKGGGGGGGGGVMVFSKKIF